MRVFVLAAAICGTSIGHRHSWSPITQAMVAIFSQGIYWAVVRCLDLRTKILGACWSLLAMGVNQLHWVRLNSVVFLRMVTKLYFADTASVQGLQGLDWGSAAVRLWIVSDRFNKAMIGQAPGALGRSATGGVARLP